MNVFRSYFGLVIGYMCLMTATSATPPTPQAKLVVPSSGAARFYPDTELVKNGRPTAVIGRAADSRRPVPFAGGADRIPYRSCRAGG